MQTNLKQKSAANSQEKATQKIKALSKEEAQNELKNMEETGAEAFPMESQDVQIDESSIKRMETSKRAVKAKPKAQKSQKKVATKKTTAKKPQEKRDKVKEQAENKIVK